MSIWLARFFVGSVRSKSVDDRGLGASEVNGRQSSAIDFESTSRSIFCVNGNKLIDRYKAYDLDTVSQRSTLE